MNRFHLLFAAVVAAASVFLALPAGPASAATYTVDRLDDNVATICSGAANDCSLRGAITNANGSMAADTINFDAVGFPVGNLNPITLTAALPTMTAGSDTIDATS